jgi:hypothetical protein
MRRTGTTLHDTDQAVTDAAPAAPSADPLSNLSRDPIMGEAGFYVDGGISSYSLAFGQPVDALLSKKPASESVVEYLKRLSEADDDVLKAVALKYLPSDPAPADPPPGAAARRAARRHSLRRFLPRHGAA